MYIYIYICMYICTYGTCLLLWASIVGPLFEDEPGCVLNLKHSLCCLLMALLNVVGSITWPLLTLCLVLCLFSSGGLIRSTGASPLCCGSYVHTKPGTQNSTKGVVGSLGDRKGPMKKKHAGEEQESQTMEDLGASDRLASTAMHVVIHIFRGPFKERMLRLFSSD